jgi:hypothetical protein
MMMNKRTRKEGLTTAEEEGEEREEDLELGKHFEGCVVGSDCK